MDKGTKGRGAAEGKSDGSGFWNPIVYRKIAKCSE